MAKETDPKREPDVYCPCGARWRQDATMRWCPDYRRHYEWEHGTPYPNEPPVRGPGWYKHPDGFGT
jgi:hypothetical protein